MCTASKKLSAPPLSTSGSGGDSNSVKGRESAGATPKGTLERKTDHVPTELCLTEDELKYKFTRVSIEKVDLFFVESGCACNLEVSIMNNHLTFSPLERLRVSTDCDIYNV